MEPNRFRFNPLVVVSLVVLALMATAIVLYFQNREPKPVAHPCLWPTAVEAHPKLKEESALQDLRDYVADIPTAEEVADEADVICVLQWGPDSKGKLVMHYYEDDDKFSDFEPLALATRHARTMIGHNAITGDPDVGQLYALRTLMMVSPEGKVYPLYEQDKDSNTRWMEDRTPDYQAGVTVTQVRFGNGGVLKLSDAFNNVPGRYIEGTSSVHIDQVGGTFEKLRNIALTPTGSDEDKRPGHPQPSSGSVTTTTTTKPKGGKTGTTTTTTTKPSRTTTTTTTRPSRTS